jgi:protein-tyrosine sulfotransferase
VFILTASRSGSTLLRFILDSHPELACPPETSVASMCAQVARTWDILENADADSTRPVDDAPALAPEAIAAVRDAADRVYGRYLRRRGKRRWCDKSLDTFQHTELILQIYPEARFLCLYRHCMDVIASGVEVCPWGLHRFGFDPFVAQNPGNSVAAIGGYWLATVQAILAFEEQHSGSCHRVRYEDLVTAPEDTAAAIFSFLGAEQVPGITRQCFDAPHEGNGPGDEKIWFTSDVTAGSLGRGARVPTAALPSAVRQAINEALGKLDYRLVNGDWNAAVGRLDPRASMAAVSGAANGHTPPGHQEVEAITRAISDQIGSRADAEVREINARWPALAGETVALVVQGTDGEHEEFHWTFGTGTNGADGHADGARPPADGEHRADGNEPAADAGGRQGQQDHGGGPVATIIAGPATWRSLLNGEANVVTEMTAGRLRCINRRDGHRIRSDELHAVAALLGLTRIPVARAQHAAESGDHGRGTGPISAVDGHPSAVRK